MGVVEAIAKRRSFRKADRVVTASGRANGLVTHAATVVDDAVVLTPHVDELRAELERLLPWRSVDGKPLGMSVMNVAYLEVDDGRPEGTAYAVLSADSFDAAAALRRAVVSVAGLSDDEWRTGWSETAGRLFAIQIYPTL